MRGFYGQATAWTGRGLVWCCLFHVFLRLLLSVIWSLHGVIFWVVFSYFIGYVIVFPFLVVVKLFIWFCFYLFVVFCFWCYGLARIMVEFAPVATSMLGFPASPGVGNRTGVVEVVMFPVPSCP